MTQLIDGLTGRRIEVSREDLMVHCPTMTMLASHWVADHFCAHMLQDALAGDTQITCILDRADVLTQEHGLSLAAEWFEATFGRTLGLTGEFAQVTMTDTEFGVTFNLVDDEGDLT